jgi:hypothetical protein
MLLIKNLKFKVRKLILKFIKELIYKLNLLNIYNYLYFIFYISFFKEYIAKKS